ncbi:MAG TPA: hypothetical protein VHH73_09640 [Verrucomicrobiae bacterium]|nr:hypothetical protein [Verrucomicrobiae bacterium]
MSLPHKDSDVPFVNEMRLSARQWLVAVALIALAAIGVPRVWKGIERFDTGPDYRIPYSLSRDYWLYERRLQQVSNPASVFLLGDSVVWGEYVLPDGTLSHFLNEQAGQADRFVNAGVNGMFPLALDGLVNYYGGTLRHRKIILQCNVLWMSNPKADLQTTKEEKFNHSRLVPQFSPRIPCYKADANERLGAVVERNVRFNAWVGHLQSAYFGDKSILNWTLQDDGNDPPRYTNSYKNPLSQITLEVPGAPAKDPQRGPASERHKPWTDNSPKPSQFEWVTLDSSLQWVGFRHLVQTLRARGNDVLVVVGPFNEHMVAKESQAGFHALRDGIVAWLTQQNVTHVIPAVLPGELYADASHPLTAGYQLLAKQLYQDPAVQKWLGRQ